MSIGSPPQQMTLSEFLELPERRVERMLIRGELWERKMTYRNRGIVRFSDRSPICLSSGINGNRPFAERFLSATRDSESRRIPIHLSALIAVIGTHGTPLFHHGKEVVFDGPPLLAVEVLSPSDRQDAIEARIDEYLAANVPLVWVVSPHHKTVTVFRPDAEPVLFSQSETLSGEPHLPGLSFPVAELFADAP